MSISIEVYRDAGDRRGRAVSDPLIGSEACAIARGRAELDAAAHDRDMITLTVAPPRPGLRRGDVIRVYDTTAPAYDGRITAIDHRRIGEIGWTTQLTLDRPRQTVDGDRP